MAVSDGVGEGSDGMTCVVVVVVLSEDEQVRNNSLLHETSLTLPVICFPLFKKCLTDRSGGEPVFVLAMI